MAILISCCCCENGYMWRLNGQMNPVIFFFFFFIHSFIPFFIPSRFCFFFECFFLFCFSRFMTYGTILLSSVCVSTLFFFQSYSSFFFNTDTIPKKTINTLGPRIKKAATKKNWGPNQRKNGETENINPKTRRR